MTDSDLEKAALGAAARELKFAIAEAEQQEAQRTLPTFEERQALYLRRAEQIVDAYRKVLVHG